MRTWGWKRITIIEAATLNPTYPKQENIGGSQSVSLSDSHVSAPACLLAVGVRHRAITCLAVKGDSQLDTLLPAFLYTFHGSRPELKSSTPASELLSRTQIPAVSSLHRIQPESQITSQCAQIRKSIQYIFMHGFSVALKHLPSPGAWIPTQRREDKSPGIYPQTCKLFSSSDNPYALLPSRDKKN